MMIGSWAERGAAMRGKISDELLRCLQMRPLEQVTLQDIARGCGLSAPALYRYFSTRDDLISHCAGYAVDTFETLATAELARQAPGRPRHLAIWRLMRVAAQDGPALPRIFDALPAQRRTHLFTAVADALLPAGLDEPARNLAALVLRAFFWEAVHSDGVSATVEEASWRAMGIG